MKNNRVAGRLALAGSIVLFCLVACAPARRPAALDEPCVVKRLRLGDNAACDELRAWWLSWKSRFILEDGRVQRPADGNDTVSEGQAYALLYAALLDDPDTFQNVWQWTEAHLSRKARFGDRLFAWQWKDGAVTDWNSASDATADAILALLIGHHRWGRTDLRDAALALGQDLMKKETAVHDDLGRVLLPGTWGRDEDGSCAQNPSYYSPAAFGMLHLLTGDSEWVRLADMSYTVWWRSGSKLDRARGNGLPPDWCLLAPDGQVKSLPGKPASHGWDALRIPMRAGLDALLMENNSAKRYLERVFIEFFQQEFEKGREHPAAVYSLWGAPADPSASLAMSAMALFAFQAADQTPPDALVAAFDRQRHAEPFNRDYYAQSLLFWPLAYRAGLFKNGK